MTDLEELLMRLEAAAWKTRQLCSMSKSPAVRGLCESLTSEIGALSWEEIVQRWSQIVDLLEVEFGQSSAPLPSDS